MASLPINQFGMKFMLQSASRTVQIRIPEILRKETDAKAVVEVQGVTVRDCMESLLRRYPKLRGEILDRRGILLLKWMIYVNRQGSISADDMTHPVKDGDTIELVPVVSGG